MSEEDIEMTNEEAEKALNKIAEIVGADVRCDENDVSLDDAGEALDNIALYAELLNNMNGEVDHEFSSLSLVLLGNHLIDAVRTVRAYLHIERECA